MQRGLANLANQRLIAHAYQIFPLAKVALTAFTTTEVRIVSLIEEEDVIERILRHLGLGKGGVRAFGPTRRTKRPSVRGSTIPSPTTISNRTWRSRIIVVHLG